MMGACSCSPFPFALFVNQQGVGQGAAYVRRLAPQPAAKDTTTSTRPGTLGHAPATPGPSIPAAERDGDQDGRPGEAAQAATEAAAGGAPGAARTQSTLRDRSLSSRSEMRQMAMRRAELHSQTSVAKQVGGGAVQGQGGARGIHALRDALGSSVAAAASTALPARPTASPPGKRPGKRVGQAAAAQPGAGSTGGGISGLVKSRRDERREQRAASAAARPARLGAAVGGAAVGGDGSAPLRRAARRTTLGDKVEEIVAL
jgi:hypothetical protein